MGSHMRSHLAKLPIPPKLETNKQAPDKATDLTQSPIQYASSLSYRPQKKPTQKFRSLKRGFFASLANSSTEKESGSNPKSPIGKSSNCCQSIVAANTNADPKQLSLNPETDHEEEAAKLLLLISKSKRPDGEDGRDDSHDQTNTQGRFICEICGKKFGSHQALGGHKASHKKTKNLRHESGNSADDKSDNVDQKDFKCPYCYKVFKSAQGLIGHKKVHISIAKAAKVRAKELQGVLIVDLNFSTSQDEQVSNTQIEYQKGQ